VTTSARKKRRPVDYYWPCYLCGKKRIGPVEGNRYPKRGICAPCVKKLEEIGYYEKERKGEVAPI
jgi:hypothetical protein